MSANFENHNLAIFSVFAVIITAALIGNSLISGDMDAFGLDTQYRIKETNDGENLDVGSVSDYSDLKKVEFSTMNEENLVINLEVGGVIPDAFDSSEEIHYYLFTLDTGEQKSVIEFKTSENGREVSFFSVESEGEKEFQGTYEVNGSSLKIKVPITEVGKSESLDFEVASVGAYKPEESSEVVEGTNDFLSNNEIVKVS